MAKTLRKYNRKMRKSGRRTKVRKQKSKRHVKRRSRKHIKKQYGGGLFGQFNKASDDKPPGKAEGEENTLACFPKEIIDVDSDKTFKLIKSRPNMRIGGKGETKSFVVDDTSIKYCGKKFTVFRGRQGLNQQNILIKNITSILFNPNKHDTEKYVHIKTYDKSYDEDENLYKFTSPIEESINALKFYNLVLSYWIIIMCTEIIPEFIRNFFRICLFLEKNKEKQEEYKLLILNILEIYSFFVNPSYHTFEKDGINFELSEVKDGVNDNDDLEVAVNQYFDPFLQAFLNKYKKPTNLLSPDAVSGIKNILNGETGDGITVIKAKLIMIYTILNYHSYTYGMGFALKTFNHYFGHIIN